MEVVSVEEFADMVRDYREATARLSQMSDIRRRWAIMLVEGFVHEVQQLTGTRAGARKFHARLRRQGMRNPALLPVLVEMLGHLLWALDQVEEGFLSQRIAARWARPRAAAFIRRHATDE